MASIPLYFMNNINIEQQSQKDTEYSSVVRVDYLPVDSLEPGNVPRDRGLLPEGYELVAVSMVYQKLAECREEAEIGALEGRDALRPLLKSGLCIGLRHEVTPRASKKRH